MKARATLLSVLLLVPVASARAAFEDEVRPIIQKTCLACHNDEHAEGGLNFKLLDRADSVISERADWDMILRRLRAGEMPPPTVQKPAELPGMIAFIELTFAAHDQ